MLCSFVSLKCLKLKHDFLRTSPYEKADHVNVRSPNVELNRVRLEYSYSSEPYKDDVVARLFSCNLTYS